MRGAALVARGDRVARDVAVRDAQRGGPGDVGVGLAAPERLEHGGRVRAGGQQGAGVAAVRVDRDHQTLHQRCGDQRGHQGGMNELVGADHQQRTAADAAPGGELIADAIDDEHAGRADPSRHADRALAGRQPRDRHLR
ncbi:MAG: hypothetical protein E6J91_25015 [Deltaproteobacteria bacterium]|nr:MAG: hypothetical protein E6J91_25015 [Deltaproteobacteria bacterium]